MQISLFTLVQILVKLFPKYPVELYECPHDSDSITLTVADDDNQDSCFYQMTKGVGYGFTLKLHHLVQVEINKKNEQIVADWSENAYLKEHGDKDQRELFEEGMENGVPI